MTTSVVAYAKISPKKVNLTGMGGNAEKKSEKLDKGVTQSDWPVVAEVSCIQPIRELLSYIV